MVVPQVARVTSISVLVMGSMPLDFARILNICNVALGLIISVKYESVRWYLLQLFVFIRSVYASW